MTGYREPDDPRTEYPRRALTRQGATAGDEVTVRDLFRFAATFADLADDEAMHRAWGYRLARRVAPAQVPQRQWCGCLTRP